MSKAKVLFIVTRDNYLLLWMHGSQDSIESFGKFESSEKAKKHAKRYREKHFPNEKDFLIVTGCDLTFNEMCGEEIAGFKGRPLSCP